MAPPMAFLGIGLMGQSLKATTLGERSLAEKGKLICVPAGTEASVSRIKPYLLGVVAQAVVDLSGEEAGKASLLKIIGNVLIMTTMEASAEINVFAEDDLLWCEERAEANG
uniref:Putative 6-phosphogluconate dehydrogenase n=1 Tax=Cladonia uncialis subsp. uncialis TaxID=180999 RepID=A0A2K9YDL1_CLAUC|nr:putative 6-phosphogluconate dehydrogenase [Cladonia uncialis subsp. uncialis]